MIVDESDARFVLGESNIPGAGRGLFASGPLAAGDRLLVVGVLIRAQSVSDQTTAFADQHKFRVGDYLLIPLGYGGMVNHSSSIPNLEKVIEGETLYLQATRAVRVGEELLFCYSEYAQERFQLR